MAEKKVTKIEKFEAIKGILEGVGETDLAETMAHEIELLAKHKGSSKPTKAELEKKEADKAMAEKVYTYIASNANCRVDDIKANVEGCDELSKSKITSFINILATDKRIERVYDKKSVTYRVIA